MRILRLGDVCVVESGGTPSRKSPTNFGGNIPWVKIGDMLQGTIRRTEETITEQGLLSSSAKLWPVGTLLVSIFATIGRTAVLGIPASSNQAIAGLQVDSSKMHTNYLRHYLDYSVKELAATGRGIAQNNINMSILKIWPVPAPPLEEQRRIAAILDKADALRTKRRQALAHLDALTQSIFHSMFGDPATNKGAFEKKPIVQLCSAADDIRCGPFGTQLKRADFTSEGVPLWGIRNVNKHFGLPTEEFVSAATAERLAVYDIRPGDIVMTRKGTIGNCALYPAEFPVGLMHSDLLRVRVNPDVVSAKFLSEQLHSSRDVDRQIQLISGGAIMAGINVGKLKTVQVVVPPLELQRTFATRIDAVERLKDIHRRHLTELDNLFASLQYRAFKGEL